MPVVVSVDVGGTGANSAAGARASLGVAAANDVVLKTGDTMTGQLTLAAGNLVFSNVGQRIIGDFSGARQDRLAFQTSTTNGATRVSVIPNGTSNVTEVSITSNSNAAGSLSFAQLLMNGGEFRIASANQAGGSYLPMTFYAGGSEHIRLTSTGNVGIGTTSPTANLHVTGTIKDTPIVSITGSATYADNAAGRVIFSDTSSAVTVTIAPAATAGFSYTIIRGNTGNVTIANSGVTRLNSASITSMNVSQYGAATVVYTATNQVIVFGDFV